GGGCGTSQKDCGGMCVFIDDPGYGCTATGCTPCSLPNAVAGCGAADGGQGCVIKSCIAPFLDCNGDPSDGCEVDPNTDDAHCGGCTAGACTNGEHCAGGACACTGGDVMCGGPDCVSLQTSSANCGKCGHLCNGGESCAGGLCQPEVIVDGTHGL